jgi:hypothetical protein
MINKDWSLDEAQEAHNKFLEDNPGYSDSDPTLPLYQWFALHELDTYEKLYDTDPYYLMLAIRVCACNGLVMPSWVIKGYIKAYDTVNNYRARSWDAVFGNPFPKGKSLAAARKKRITQTDVWKEVTLILKCEPDTPIDDGLFERVGKKFNLGKTLTSEYFYEVKRYYKR